MRAPLLILPLACVAAACSNQPQASDAELEDFVPPTLVVRGDVVPRAESRFTRLDKNADGVLTPDEFPARRADRYRALDRDANGKVSKSELVEGALRRFDSIDANKDGQITGDERAAARDKR